MTLAAAKAYAVAAWTLDEASGTRSDSIGTSHLTDDSSVGSATGKFGGGALFSSASTDSLSRADGADLTFGDEDMSITGWWESPSSLAGSNQVILSRRAGNGVINYAVYYNSGSNRLVGTYGIVSVVSSVAISTSTWYFFTLVHDSANNLVILRVNGTTDSDADTGFDLFLPVAASFRVGDDGAGQYLDGMVDDLVFMRGYVFSSADHIAVCNGGAGVAFASWVLKTRSDTFDRANTSSALGPPSDGGTPWVAYDAGGGSSWGISSNQAYDVYDAGARMIATLEAASADVDVQATITTTAVAQGAGLCCRATDLNNFFGVIGDNFNGYRLLKWDAGTGTALGTWATAPVDGDDVMLRCSGAALTVYVNGVSRIQATDSFNITETRHGLYAFNAYTTSARWNDFSIVPARAIDELNAGFTSAGFFTLGTGGYGGNAKYSSGTLGIDFAAFSFTGLTSGLSTRVSATWPEQFNLYTATQWKVYDSDGTTVLATASLDQVQDPAALTGGFTDGGFPWAPIGTVTPTGTTLTVKLLGDGNGYIVADAVLVEQTAGGGTTFTRSLSESLAGADAWARRADGVRLYSNNFGAAEAYARVADGKRSLSDSLGPSDAFARLTTALRALSDTAAAADAYARLANAKRLLAEALGLHDAATLLGVTAGTYTIAVIEALAAQDTAARTSSSQRSLTDTAAAADAFARLATAARSVSDAGAFADAYARTLAWGRALTDSAAASDLYARLASAARGLSDAGGAADAYARQADAARGLNETLGLAQAYARLADAARALAEAAGVHDLASAALATATVAAVVLHLFTVRAKAVPRHPSRGKPENRFEARG